MLNWIIWKKLFWHKHSVLPSQLELENTPTASLQRGETPPTNVLDMTQNNLIMRFQWCWGFVECGASFIDVAPRSTLSRNGSIYGINRSKLHLCAKLNCLNKNCLIKLNSLKQKWFRQLNSVLTFKLRTYAKRNCLKWKCLWHWNCT